MTEQTDDYLRNKISLLTMFFWEVRRKFAHETDAEIFDFHSSSIDEWNEIRQVTDKILGGGLVNHCDKRAAQEENFGAPVIRFSVVYQFEMMAD